MDYALTHVITTTSVLSTPPVDMKVYPVKTQSKPQPTPPRPLLCGRYPPSATFVLPLLGWGPRSVFDPDGIGDPILRQLALMIQPTSNVSWVRR